jgi:hypothetical protein
MNEPRRYQFTVRRLLLLSTAIAVVFACAGGFGAPLIYQIAFGLYYTALLTVFIMLLPNVRRRLAAIQKRRELALEVAKRKLAVPPPDSDSLLPPPADGSQ